METNMDTEALTEALSVTHLHDKPEEPESLLFNPQPGSGLTPKALENIPSLLFRVATPISDGETTRTWVRSVAACKGEESSSVDTFSYLGSRKQNAIANTLNQHLRWWNKNDMEDNFMSWTSSLLFALRYIYYRHLEIGSSLEEIELYVIDTRRFETGTFIQDLDLINAFRGFDNVPFNGQDLHSLWDMRVNRGYYFGEYLSQGSLNIADKCHVISAKSLFDEDRLCRVQPQFKHPHSSRSPGERNYWAKEVLRLRTEIWLDSNVMPSQMNPQEIPNRIKAIDEIASNFSPDWKFLMAIYFATLIGPKPEAEDQGVRVVDNAFFEYFRSEQFSGYLDEKLNVPSVFRVIARDTMPELTRVKEIIREISKDIQLRRALEFATEADINLRRLHKTTISPGPGGPILVADTNTTLSRAGEELGVKMFKVRALCKRVIKDISGSGSGDV